MRALVVALAVAAGIGAAAADEPGGAGDRKARAARLVEEASAAQKRADYATAIVRLQAAYALIPHPDLLYNLGQAYRLAARPWDAIEQYERYLAVEPRGTFATKATTWLAELRAATAGRSRPAAVEPVGPAVVAPPPPAPPPPPPRVALDPIAAPTADRAGPGWRRPVAIGLGVAGVVGLGVGVSYGLRARALSDELSDHTGPWTDAVLAKQAEGAQAETRAIWLSATGAALMVGGVVLFALDGRRRGPREAAVTPVLDGRTLGIAVHGAL